MLASIGASLTAVFMIAHRSLPLSVRRLAIHFLGVGREMQLKDVLVSRDAIERCPIN